MRHGILQISIEQAEVGPAMDIGELFRLQLYSRSIYKTADANQ
jgi:hypothetical protein